MQPKMQLKVKRQLINFVLFLATAGAGVAVGGYLPQLYKEWRGSTHSGDFAVHVDNLPHALTLYGTSTCPHCVAARKYLQQAQVLFNDLLVDESKSAEQSFKQLNQDGVPVLVSKNQLVVGFDQKAYAALLKEHALKLKGMN